MNLMIKAGLSAALLGFAIGASASPTIELKDGSRIQGEIQGIEHGTYTIVSPSLGTVYVAQSNIVRIEYGGRDSKAMAKSEKPPARDDAMSQEFQQLQSSIAQDPATMQSIMS